MTDRLKITFSAPAMPESGTLVLFCGDDLTLPQSLTQAAPAIAAAFKKAAAVDQFKGKALTALTLLAPGELAVDRLIVVGLGTPKEQTETDDVMLGGFVLGRFTGSKDATVLLEGPGEWRGDGAAAADLALGMRLRGYSFTHYKKRKKSDEPETTTHVTIALADPGAARKQAKARDAVADGVITARDLVNEPPNVLSPEEFAKRAQALEKLGVEVEVLDDKKLEKIGMRALLGVGQGSARGSRVVIMRWNGARNAKDRPVAFIGKGVVFDTGGISIKPAQGMEDMKGDMAGAATVVGLMQALATRKAKANVIGAIGLVENMPDGKAQRPGDIVTSLSGQTIEIINTDAEGRLVLADVLWYIKEEYKPSFMIDLATLTGRSWWRWRKNMPDCFPTTTNCRSSCRPPARPRANWSGACRWARPMTR
jgi:leucyl aminopeptidase